ncbi:MAG: Neelaredoxin [Candidatus Aegiribacteria sp.]|nr:Neelaredoxin [Candidatus Aegiribacteria sp.]
MLNELLQTADWKSEKHVPVIEVEQSPEPDEMFDVKVTLGKEVDHPNTTGHHIRWIELYFKPDEAKFPYQVGRVQFTAHGESASGADEGPVYTHHGCVFTMKTSKAGTLMAMSYCNIHGLWQSEEDLSFE